MHKGFYNNLFKQDYVSCNGNCYYIAARYLTVLENVVFDEHTREVDYFDRSVTGENKL